MADEEYVEIEDVKAIRATELALQVDIDGDYRWVPKSVIVDESEIWKAGQEGKLCIKSWFAKKEGLGG